MPRDGGYLAARNSLIVLAYTYSAYSAKGGLGRAQAVPHGRVFFLGFHALSQARHTCFFSPGRDNYLFGPCDPHLSLSHASQRVGTFSRVAVNFFSRFVRHRARWLGWHRAGPRAVNMRAVAAATFTNNVVIEIMCFFSPTICSKV